LWGVVEVDTRGGRRREGKKNFYLSPFVEGTGPRDKKKPTTKIPKHVQKKDNARGEEK